MRAFRSPLLKALPPDRQKGAAERIARRFVISFMALFTLAVLFFTVRQKLLPIGGFYWLYWFHDNIYLLLKGAIFTRYYPWSLAWLGVGATLVAIAWLTYVLGKSPLQAPHAFLVRWASRNAGLHPLITGMGELFKRMGLPMLLMRNAVAVERTHQLAQWFQMRGSTGERRLRHRFMRQTDLWISLAQVFQQDPGVKDEALSMGLATMLWIDPSKEIDPKTVEHQLLNRMIARLIRLLPLPKDADAFNEAVAFPGAFQEDSIALDTLLLFSGFVPGGEARLAQALGNMEKDRVVFGDLVRLRLAQATEDRVGVLETMRRDLEFSKYGPDLLRKLETKLPARDDLADDAWRENAHQALILACHTARMLKEPHLLARYLDAVEALALAAEAVSPSPDSPLAALRDHSLALTRDLPTTEIYRFAAVLTADFENQEWTERRTVTWPSDIAGTGHVRTSWALSAAFQLAAGREGDRLVEPEVAS